MEPLGDLTVQRGRTGDEEPDPATEASPDLVEHQPVEQRVLPSEQERDRLALSDQPVAGEAHLEGPVEDLLLEATLGGLHGDDPRVRLLEDAGRGAHEGRAYDGQVVDDLV